MNNVISMCFWIYCNKSPQGIYRNSDWKQCLKLSQKSCRSSGLESEIRNINLKKNQQKVLGPPPKLSVSDWRTYGNFQHWLEIVLAVREVSGKSRGIFFWDQTVATLILWEISLLFVDEICGPIWHCHAGRPWSLTSRWCVKDRSLIGPTLIFFRNLP